MRRFPFRARIGHAKAGGGLLALSLWLLSGMAAMAQERVALEDGETLAVFMVRPAASEQPGRLLILFGGGPGNASIAADVSRWLGSQFAARGWVVAAPVSPDNRSFRGPRNNRRVAQLIKTLQQRENIAQGKTMLAGISNGGFSALEVARRDPENYFGVIAVPALSTSEFDNRPLRGFPVYLRIGGEDELGWADRFDETVDAFLGAGVDLDAAVLDSAGHMFQMNWETLDPWLDRVAPR